MKVLKKTLLILLPVLLLLCIAGWIWRKDIKAAVLPEVQELKVSKVSVLNDSARVNLHLEIKNHDYFRYNLKHTYVQVFNDTIQLLEYGNDSLFALEKGEHRIIDLEFMLPIKKIIKRIKKLQGSDSTDLKINGNLILATRFGDYTVPIDKNVAIKVPTPPKIEIQQVEYLGAEGNMYAFNIKLDVTNRSDQDLKVVKVHYSFHGEDLIESEGKYDKAIEAGPGKTYSMELPVNIQANNRLELLSRIMRDKDVIKFKLSINGVIETVAGIKEEIPVVYTKTGSFELVDRSRKPKFEIVRKH